MSSVGKITKWVGNKFLNYYELEATFRSGQKASYYMASRNPDPKTLKCADHNQRADGVIIYGVYGEKKDRVALVRQYRFPVGGYIYEFPAGLVEKGEDLTEAGTREMFEETGLTFHPVSTARPFFTTCGMTDECCGTVFGYCEGQPTNIHQELSEDIEVVLADRDECRRILKEENVAIMCAYMLMHFIASEGDPLAFLEK